MGDLPGVLSSILDVGGAGQLVPRTAGTQRWPLATDRLKSLGHMATAMAYDVNNVLLTILGRLELLLMEPFPQHLQRELEVVRQATLDGAGTVRRLQEFGSSRPPRVPQGLDIADLMRSVSAPIEARSRAGMGGRGAGVRVCLDLQGGRVLGDRIELGEALGHIVENALEAMPARGQLTLRSRSRAGEVEVVVVDTGFGMSPETADQVFDPFFTTKPGGRRGLGMSATHGVIRRHRGHIGIESSPGNGTAVTVVLPAAPSDPGAAELASAPRAADARRAGHLLVVDDEPGLREILSEALRLDGHEVVTADSGRAGLGAFTRRAFDLVLTDLGMPDISGVELARRLKATRPDLPVGLISGWDVSEESLRAQGATVDFVVRKPFALAAIRSQVRTWLGAR